MWALNLSRAELMFFTSPETIPGGYAILSHVWDKQEQNFQEIQELSKQCATTGKNPRDLVCDKIRQFCIVAERDGHEWGWADTCCIDKTSSAELSEAINSMYRYYTLADTCYAYLRDVPTRSANVETSDESFRESRWHKRGWTLQELLAPVLLVFLSQDWERLGTKAEYAEVLEDVTGIPDTVLRLEQGLTDFSIAQRMSWAANRKTTRLEDEAYCLMGIFGVNMPTLYGEGRLAFRRLQEEIMKQSTDTTLFAWGTDLSTVGSTGVHDKDHQHNDPWSYLFARSPSDFESCYDISFVPPRLPSKLAIQTCALGVENQSGNPRTTTPAQSIRVGLPTFSITPHGVHARLPVFHLKGSLIAVLFWGWVWGAPDRDEHLPIGLYLTPCPDPVDPLRPLYHCGFGTRRMTLIRGYTFDDFSSDSKKAMPEWEELYIAHSPPPDGIQTIPRLTINSSLSSPFHFPRQEMELLHRERLQLVDSSRLRYSWNGHPSAYFAYRFTHLDMLQRTMVLQLGRCASPSSESSEQLRPNASGAHWARMHFCGADLPSTYPEHSCPEDHICEWLDSKRTFTDYQTPFPLSITLLFAPWKRNPTTTQAVHFVVHRKSG